MRGSYRVLVGRSDGKTHLEVPGLDGTIILKCVFDMWEGAWTGLIWLRTGTDGRLCDCGNEPSDSIKCGEFLDWLRNC
jgi:hypothetical protein